MCYATETIIIKDERTSSTKSPANQLAVEVAVTVGYNNAVRFTRAKRTLASQIISNKDSGLPDRVRPSARNIEAHKATNNRHQGLQGEQ
jgi:hypothetical protein